MNSVNQLGEFQASQATKAISIQALSKLWAKKYVQQLDASDTDWDASSKGVRSLTAQHLLESLRSTSAQAWIKTETLLAREVTRHGINYKLIDPWEIARNTHYIYEKALLAYAEQVTPQRLSVFIGSDLGRIRHKYTVIDPRVIGFVSLQFHYSGQLLLQSLSQQEQVTLATYFQVIDDHLYMPLQRFYKAAAGYDYNAPALETIRQLLPTLTDTATRIAARIAQLYPNYQCYSGTLSNAIVRSSSIRDIEMFQIYLWVCILENSMTAIHHELFPLCVMLYPTLKVRWELVRQMIHLLGSDLHLRLKPSQVALFKRYFQALWEMFSPEVFPESFEDEAQSART